MKKTLVLVGNDKKGREFITEHASEYAVFFALETGSRKPKRIIKLVKRGSLSLKVLIKMVFAELLRNNFHLSKIPQIKDNNDLALLISDNDIRRVILYHVGLIINKRVIHSGIDIWNIHCAKIPDYGGLMAIARALENDDLYQEATLHEVVEEVDAGKKISTLPYKLEKQNGYRLNEDIAFNAGKQLLIHTLNNLNLQIQ